MLNATSISNPRLLKTVLPSSYLSGSTRITKIFDDMRTFCLCRMCTRVSVSSLHMFSSRTDNAREHAKWRDLCSSPRLSAPSPMQNTRALSLSQRREIVGFSLRFGRSLDSLKAREHWNGESDTISAPTPSQHGAKGAIKAPSVEFHKAHTFHLVDIYWPFFSIQTFLYRYFSNDSRNSADAEVLNRPARGPTTLHGIGKWLLVSVILSFSHFCDESWTIVWFNRCIFNFNTRLFSCGTTATTTWPLHWTTSISLTYRFWTTWTISSRISTTDRSSFSIWDWLVRNLFLYRLLKI